MSSFASHPAVGGPVPTQLSFGYRDFENPSGTRDPVPSKHLTMIASSEVGSARRCIRSIPGLPELNSMRCMEYSPAIGCFAPAVHTPAGETKTENWIGSVDVVNMDVRNHLVIDPVESDSGSGAVVVHWGREHGRAAVRRYFLLLADAIGAP